MALVKDSAGRETVAPRKWRPLPQQGRGPVLPQDRPAPAPREQFRAQPAPPPARMRPTDRMLSIPKNLATAIDGPREAVSAIMAFGRPEPAPAVVNALEPSRDPRTLDQALRSTWGNLENEGAARAVKAAESGALPQALQTQREQQMLNMAEHYNTLARMGERDRLRQEREKADRKERVKPLSAAEWNAYTPEQQAAVAANADLLAAVQQDFDDVSRHGKIGDEGRRVNNKLDDYQERVEALFGKGNRGSVGYKGLEYAPNTIAFLDERGITAADLAGRNLDDLISGDALITRKTIENLGREAPALDPFKTGEMSAQDRRDYNLRFAQNLAKGQLQFQEELASKLARGDQMIQELTSRSTNAAAQNLYGARPLRDPKPKHITPETKARLDRYLESLARTDMDPAKSIEMINTDLLQRGAKQEEVDEVYEMLANVTRSALQNQDQQWFPDSTLQMRSPLEVAEALGSVPLKRRERE